MATIADGVRPQEGYPCMVRKSTTFERNGVVHMLNDTDKCMVVQSTDRWIESSHCYLCVIKNLSRPNQPEVKITEASLVFGTTRKCGDWLFKFNGRQNVQILTQPPPISDASARLFDHTAHYLMEEIWLHRHDFGFLTEQFKALSSRELHARVEVVLQGTRDIGTNRVLNNIDAEWWKLKNIGTTVTNNNLDNTGGNYHIDYWKFDQEHARSPMRYSGQTNDLSGRKGSHNTARSRGFGSHYSISRHAGEMHMYAWSIHNGDELTRVIGEQVSVSLFETYGKRLLEVTDDDQQEVKQHKNAPSAQVLSEVAKQVFEKTGWQPPSQRDRYGMDPWGLNFISPLSEKSFLHDETYWTRQKVGSHMERLWGTPRVCNQSVEDGTTFMLFCYIGTSMPQTNPDGTPRVATKGRKKFYIHALPSELPDLPSEGQQVWPVFERMRDDSLHPNHFASLHGIGAWAVWDRLRSFAIAMVWQDKNGAWKKTYAQRRAAWRSYSPDDPGFPENFNDAYSIYNFFRRVPWSSKRPKQFVNLGIARVQTQEYDHLTQVINFVKDSSVNPAIDGPIRKPWQSIIQEMRDIGLQNVDGEWGYRTHFPYFKGSRHGNRKACDRCCLSFARNKAATANPNSMPGEGGHLQTCTRVGAKRYCGNCEAMGIPCSWTNHDTLKTDERFARALLPPVKARGGSTGGFRTIDIPNPGPGLAVMD